MRTKDYLAYADSIPHVIRQEHCLHCGNCASVCPVSAVERR